jgi:hypothetical protein
MAPVSPLSPLSPLSPFAPQPPRAKVEIKAAQTKTSDCFINGDPSCERFANSGINTGVPLGGALSFFLGPVVAGDRGSSVVAGNFLERGLGVREAAQAGLLEADPLQSAPPAPIAGGSQVIQEQGDRMDGQGDRVAKIARKLGECFQTDRVLQVSVGFSGAGVSRNL